MELTLAQARVLRGFSQEQFAKKLGISVPTLIKYEKDQTSMRVHQAQKSAELLGYDFDGVSFIPEEGGLS